MCAKKVRETLSKMDGVKSAAVDFTKKTATVKMKKGNKAPLRRKAIEKLLLDNGGFKVTSFGPEAKTIVKKKS